MEDRLPPHNLDAEMSVLGSLLVGDEKSWDEVQGILTESDFYKPAHQLIFSSAQKLEEKGQPIDVVTISNDLEKRSF